MVSEKAARALACYREGFNCAQAVLSAFSEELGLDKETALRLSCGFGAGMSGLQQTCGVVSGACMVIGLRYGKSEREDHAAKERSYKLTREFVQRFTERNGSTCCRVMLNADLRKDDPAYVSKRIKLTCPKAVRDAADILTELLEEGGVSVRSGD